MGVGMKRWMCVNVCICGIFQNIHTQTHGAVEVNESCELGQQKENAKPLREHLHT